MVVSPHEPPPGDEDLAAAVTRGLQTAQAAGAAFGQLYDRHAPRLLAFLRARVPPADLEDAHQEIWQRVWRFLPTGFRGGNFRAWLYQIARNYLIDLARKRRPLPADRAEEARDVADPGQPSPGAVLAGHEELERLRHCLGELDTVALVVVRGKLGGQSYEEICRDLQIAPERAYKVFHQAKEQLRHCIERQRS